MERSKPTGASSASTGLRRLPFLVVAAMVACAWSFHAWRGSRNPDLKRLKSPTGSASSFSTPYKNTGPGVDYVGDEVCARCHAEISQAYRLHPMGRSAATAENVLSGISGLVFEVDGLAYSIERRGNRVVHREARKDGSGAVLTTTEAEVHYVIGSGMRGYSFLVERDGGLFQSPIAWYSQRQRWDLAPGYHEQNRHFDRVITAGCLFCHTNRFDRMAGNPPVFHGLTIGCERCHGPGALHARHPEEAGKDLTIVNPADLEPVALRENVCEQCHFQGTDRIEVTEGSSFDYRPGLPLEQFLLVSTSRFDPTRRNSAVGHVEQMRESRCYEQSGGKLGCTSCHDPHRLPGPATQVSYYRDRCLACHIDLGCSLPSAVRLSQSPQDDCVACHMPRTSTTNVAHTALTNHTVPRR